MLEPQPAGPGELGRHRRTESATWVKRLLPGGSATELVVGAWNGGLPGGDSLLLLLPTLAWVVLAVLLAARSFSGDTSTSGRVTPRPAVGSSWCL